MELLFDIDREKREMAREAYNVGYFLYRLLDIAEILGDESCPFESAEMSEMARRLQSWAIDGAAGIDRDLAVELRQRAEGHQAFRAQRSLMRQAARRAPGAR